ncbi:MAG: bifunctional phosphopantothenoylcysteine decarboxylase/phosphopantothenate--cysteine ligase CoaBC [Acidobacteria bacterium]|nr:MAG: bifunctional phosphopantothenoylcysteine decarboxylase/phosphopantothenate--cysteine ligase CoaBC [Acidobacteriota bacterium]RPJ85551.1 MAG: bifunctional phosphopantothenoylcysteine decarboxylase/phosphopantothenate--cysteine ligase CoaBC [Acidobacteriota bacterium]
MAYIALGVTGGIGAYKAVEVARLLQRSGHSVVAVMTKSARRFVGPLTFEAITGRPVITSQFAPGANATIEHIAVASSIDMLLVAPATANIIGKFARGIADDFLSSLYLATKAPLLLAPAMNTNMWEHPAVQENLAVLVGRGAEVVEPGVGFLACGWEGKGRLAEPEAIVGAAEALLRGRAEARRPSADRGDSWRGRRVLVTAGPTFEDIDPVRYIGNRSSGRMGFALAREAAARGASVTLVCGPASIDAPAGIETVRVRSAADMHAAVMARAFESHLVVMAAAVADYTPEKPGAEKIQKSDAPLVLTLRRTEDILAGLGGERRRRGAQLPGLVGFAAETSEVVPRARAKRQAKHVDIIVANDVSRNDAGFDVETNAVTMVSGSGEIDVPRASKDEIARAILDQAGRIMLDAEKTA